METIVEFAKKLCEKYGIPYKVGKEYATIDGVPINKIKTPIFQNEIENQEVYVNSYYCVEDNLNSKNYLYSYDNDIDYKICSFDIDINQGPLINDAAAA